MTKRKYNKKLRRQLKALEVRQIPEPIRVKARVTPTIGAVLAALILIVVGSTVLLVRALHVDSPNKIPHRISSQAAFPLFSAKDGSGLVIDKGSYKYQNNGDDKVLTFKVTLVENSGDVITLSEQAYPDNLIYEKLTATFADQQEIGTATGKLTVGYPKNTPDKQAAVISTGDTLIFAQPSKQLTAEQWRTLFNGLEKVN